MITRQMTKQITTKQVSSILDSIITNVVLKNQKRVSWMPGGIQEARTFEIEPWRSMKPTPKSFIKLNNEIAANPFTLPLKMKHMNPYFDYSSWSPPKPISTMGCCGSPHVNILKTRNQTYQYMTPLSSIIESSDHIVKCEPVFHEPRLARCDKTITLAEIYEIAEQIKLAEQERGSYGKFLEESEMHECGVKAKMD